MQQLSEIPKPPRSLTVKAAKDKFTELCLALFEAGKLNAINKETVELAAMAYSQWCQLAKDSKKQKENMALVRAARLARAEYANYLRDLGCKIKSETGKGESSNSKPRPIAIGDGVVVSPQKANAPAVRLRILKHPNASTNANGTS